MVLDMLIFALMAKFYKYVEVPDKETEGNDVPMHRKRGSVNSSFVDDSGNKTERWSKNTLKTRNYKKNIQHIPHLTRLIANIETSIGIQYS